MSLGAVSFAEARKRYSVYSRSHTGEKSGKLRLAHRGHISQVMDTAHNFVVEYP